MSKFISNIITRSVHTDEQMLLRTTRPFAEKITELNKRVKQINNELPKRPKQPRNPFLLFSAANRLAVQQQLQTNSVTAIAKELSKRWKVEDRTPYEQQTQTECENYKTLSEEQKLKFEDCKDLLKERTDIKKQLRIYKEFNDTNPPKRLVLRSQVFINKKLAEGKSLQEARQLYKQLSDTELDMLDEETRLLNLDLKTKLEEWLGKINQNESLSKEVKALAQDYYDNRISYLDKKLRSISLKHVTPYELEQGF